MRGCSGTQSRGEVAGRRRPWFGGAHLRHLRNWLDVVGVDIDIDIDMLVATARTRRALGGRAP
jgi:hypothetical protein